MAKTILHKLWWLRKLAEDRIRFGQKLAKELKRVCVDRVELAQKVGKIYRKMEK